MFKQMILDFKECWYENKVKLITDVVAIVVIVILIIIAFKFC